MADLHHASVLLDVKADAACRTLSGIAATPTLDRQSHIFDVDGATFTNPVPLLLHHDQERAIGTAILTKQGAAIQFDATLAETDEPGPLQELLGQVRQQIKSGLLKGVSIGWRPLADGLEYVKGGILKIVKSEICELSLVTVPANRDATILRIKSAEMGRLSGAPNMTIAEQIAQWSNTRVPLAAQLADMMAESASKGETLDTKSAEKFDGVKAKVEEIDDHITRLRASEQLLMGSASPVTTTTATVAPVRKTYSVMSVKPNVPPGTAFVRLACAKLVCNGNLHEAAEYAKRWDDTTPEVSLYLKAAIAPGTTTDATWAQPLVNQNIAADFLELLRPATIVGRIPGLRDAPFNTKVPSQTAGGTYGWVGESKPKPVSKLAFSSETLGINKVAGIIVLTEELVRLSSPKAEDLVRRDMVAGIAQFIDQQFIDPAVAAVAGVNPASITNGAPTAAATTNPLADIMGLINHFATNNIPVDGLTFILSPANALSLSFRTNIDGSPQFPGIGINGGSYRGINFVTSNTAGTNVIAVQPSLVLYADDGGVTIDASREASLQMDSAPMSPVDATTVMVSLWQANCVGLRAERFITWKRVNTNAVKYLTAAAYPAPASEAPELP